LEGKEINYRALLLIDQDFQNRRERKKMKIGQVFGHLAEKIYSFFQKAFLPLLISS